MKLFPVLPVLWISLLILQSSHSVTKAEDTETCEDDTLDPSELKVHSSSVKGDHVEKSAVNHKNFLCLFFPTNELNCSWSFPRLQEGAQLSVAISICDDYTTTDHLNQFSEGRVGSVSMNVSAHERLNVILQFNITLQDKWTVYVYKYNMEMLEVPSPPQNVSASFKDGGLLVTWSKPYSFSDPHESCFEYQLDLGDQGGLKNVPNGKMSHMELIADPSKAYRVRVRTRHMDDCMGNSQWSVWSHTIILEQPDKLSLLVIISVSLGIPMILLALLLLVRHQRVYEVLFPPIPRPPQKYKGFLEKSETFNVFHPAASAELVEEITEVEDAMQDRDKSS